ncbi:molybdopterin cofactor-binding domain-containing protein [Ochrobactrum vermis]|uniref:Molybdopterin cofactor-binding domain-containing protein n=1 Tax=Ochrobactrum vermis TaxID=1827297 RepID=A0ABU8PMQ4_9HYPH|nr:molybdopterin cofactor-binding domain-containing protein [Ochrobactrum vermis]PQZ26949.1 aldehyde oxidase [Ochrobactrum vermis]
MTRSFTSQWLAVSESSKYSMDRRSLLKFGAVAGLGLILEIRSGEIGKASAGTIALNESKPLFPSAWIRIGTDNRIQVVSHKFDSGTGMRNALGLILAEELDVDWNNVEVVSPNNPLAKEYIHPLWGMHATGGGTTVALEWNNLRQVGATARAMLIAEAAERWSVDAGTLSTKPGRVIDRYSDRSMHYGELAEGAAKRGLPEHISLKNPRDFRLVGKPQRSYKLNDKLTGRAQYAIDIRLPDMVTAIVVHAPVIKARLKSFNEDEIKASPGIIDAFEMELPETISHFRPDHPPAAPLNGATQSGIAIVGRSFWACQKARALLEAEWHPSPMANFSSDQAIADMETHVHDAGLKSHHIGDPDQVFRSGKSLEAVYRMPYKAHAQMEPQSVIAWVKADEVEYWGGIQVPSRCAQASETIAGISRDSVRIHITDAGGSFGAREGLHPILEVTYIAKKMSRPVKLLYSREDDIRGLYYHSATVHKARFAFDKGGKPSAFSLRAVSPSIKQADDPGFLSKAPVDPSCTEGIRDDFHYDIDALDLAWVRHEPGFPHWWWRAVSYVPNIFAVESMIDEAAYAAQKDPLTFRRNMLGRRPDLLRVLDRAAELSGWTRSVASRRKGEARGMGVATYDGYKSNIAVVAEVSVVAENIRILGLTCVADCGVAVDPVSVEQQIAGGIYWGISTALMNEIHIEKGMVRESNFHDYPVLRMSDAPPLTIEIFPPSDRPPSGVGELSNPVVVPAIGNAIFAATGKRLRQTPFRITE